MQEAIDHASMHNWDRLFGLLLGIIAEHMRQDLGVEDAARRGDEGAEILLPVESIAEADALGSKMRSGDARALIGSDLHALPVFVRGPGAVELTARGVDFVEVFRVLAKNPRLDPGSNWPQDGGAFALTFRADPPEERWPRARAAAVGRPFLTACALTSRSRRSSIAA